MNTSEKRKQHLEKHGFKPMADEAMVKKVLGVKLPQDMYVQVRERSGGNVSNWIREAIALRREARKTRSSLRSLLLLNIMNQDTVLSLIVTFDGEKYRASLNIPNSYFSVASTPMRAIISWVIGVKKGIEKYENGEVTLDYFVERLGISREFAIELLEKETWIETINNKVRLEELYKNQ